MIKVWRNRIEAGDQLFSHCPEKYKSEVLELMKMDVENGIITQEQFNELISK